MLFTYQVRDTQLPDTAAQNSETFGYQERLPAVGVMSIDIREGGVNPMKRPSKNESRSVASKSANETGVIVGGMDTKEE